MRWHRSKGLYTINSYTNESSCYYQVWRPRALIFSYKKSDSKRPDSHHLTTSYAGARVLIYREKSHCQVDWIVMSTCPLISFPGEKSIWETQLPSEHCLENTESELGELDYPGNIIMRIWQTDESPSFSLKLDLSSRLNIFSSLVQETAHKNTFSLLFFQVVLLLLKVFIITSISWPFFISHIVVTNQFPISNLFCIYHIL